MEKVQADFLCTLINGKTTLPIINTTYSNVNLKKGELIRRATALEVDPVSITRRVLPEEDLSDMRKPILESEMNIREAITDGQRDLYLLSNKFRGCFAQRIKELGCTSDAMMKIEKFFLMYRPPYRAAWAKREV